VVVFPTPPFSFAMVMMMAILFFLVVLPGVFLASRMKKI
jgi:hypothetical protein